MREAGRASGGVRGLEKGRKRFLGREKPVPGETSLSETRRGCMSLGESG